MPKPLRLMLSFVLLLLFAEFGLRMGIFLRWAPVRDADLYRDWTSDEDYWKLRHLWGKKVGPIPRDVQDPFLGWSIARTAANPLGATIAGSYTPDYQNPALLFMGDAFVQGSGDYTKRLPQRLGSLTKIPAYNLGMRGYGLDQIYLRTQRGLYPFRRPTALVGITTIALDRSILRFRTGPKPYFSINEGRLMLRGVPVDSNPDSWIERNPVRVSSYLGSMLRRRARLLFAHNDLEVLSHQWEKTELNRRIFAELFGELRARAIPNTAVLFYTMEEMAYEGWRETFLKEELKRLGATYIDTKPLLLREAKRHHRKISSYYLAEGHLNDEGTEVVAQGIAKELKIATRLN